MITVGRPPVQPGMEGEAAPSYGVAGITVTPDSLVALDVQNAPVYALTESIARKFGYDLVLYATPTHKRYASHKGPRARGGARLPLPGAAHSPTASTATRSSLARAKGRR